MSKIDSEQKGDFLVGNILIAVELREYFVYLELTDWRIHIGCEFFLQAKESACYSIDPINRTGEITNLWQACGKTVVACDWGNVPEFAFDNGLYLRVPDDGRPRGTLWSKHHSVIEDF